MKANNRELHKSKTDALQSLEDSRENIHKLQGDKERSYTSGAGSGLASGKFAHKSNAEVTVSKNTAGEQQQKMKLLNSSAGTLTDPLGPADLVISPQAGIDRVDESSGETRLRSRSRAQNIGCDEGIRVKTDSRISRLDSKGGSRYGEVLLNEDSTVMAVNGNDYEEKKSSQPPSALRLEERQTSLAQVRGAVQEPGDADIEEEIATAMTLTKDSKPDRMGAEQSNNDVALGLAGGVTEREDLASSSDDFAQEIARETEEDAPAGQGTMAAAQMLQSIIQDETAEFDRADIQGSVDQQYHDFAAKEESERLEEAKKAQEIEKQRIAQQKAQAAKMLSNLNTGLLAKVNIQQVNLAKVRKVESQQPEKEAEEQKQKAQEEIVDEVANSDRSHGKAESEEYTDDEFEQEESDRNKGQVSGQARRKRSSNDSEAGKKGQPESLNQSLAIQENNQRSDNQEPSSAEVEDARPGPSGQEAMPEDWDGQQEHQEVGPVAPNGELSSYSGQHQPILKGGRYLSGDGGGQPSSETQHPPSSTQENRAHVSSADYAVQPAAVEARLPAGHGSSTAAQEERKASMCADYSQEVQLIQANYQLNSGNEGQNQGYGVERTSASINDPSAGRQPSEVTADVQMYEGEQLPADQEPAGDPEQQDFGDQLILSAGEKPEAYQSIQYDSVGSRGNSYGYRTKKIKSKNADKHGKLPNGLKFASDAKLELSPQRQRVTLDAFSREHDYETFMKKRDVLHLEHRQFLEAQKKSRTRITDALIDKQKIPDLAQHDEEKHGRNLHNQSGICTMKLKQRFSNLNLRPKRSYVRPMYNPGQARTLMPEREKLTISKEADSRQQSQQRQGLADRKEYSVSNVSRPRQMKNIQEARNFEPQRMQMRKAASQLKERPRNKFSLSGSARVGRPGNNLLLRRNVLLHEHTPSLSPTSQTQVNLPLAKTFQDQNRYPDPNQYTPDNQEASSMLPLKAATTQKSTRSNIQYNEPRIEYLSENTRQLNTLGLKKAFDRKHNITVPVRQEKQLQEYLENFAADSSPQRRPFQQSTTLEHQPGVVIVNVNNYSFNLPDTDQNRALKQALTTSNFHSTAAFDAYDAQQRSEQQQSTGEYLRQHDAARSATANRTRHAFAPRGPSGSLFGQATSAFDFKSSTSRGQISQYDQDKAMEKLARPKSIQSHVYANRKNSSTLQYPEKSATQSQLQSKFTVSAGNYSKYNFVQNTKDPGLYYFESVRDRLGEGPGPAEYDVTHAMNSQACNTSTMGAGRAVPGSGGSPFRKQPCHSIPCASRFEREKERSPSPAQYQSAKAAVYIQRQEKRTAMPRSKRTIDARLFGKQYAPNIAKGIAWGTN